MANLLYFFLAELLRSLGCFFVPDGQAHADGCPGLEVPQGARRMEALKRVQWLSSLPWPWD